MAWKGQATQEWPMERELTWPFLPLCAVLQPDHIYSPTPIYSNLADKVFMFASSYQKILPVKSNASMSHIWSEKGNGGGVAFIGWCRTSVSGALWVFAVWIWLVSVQLLQRFTQHGSTCILERYITNKHAFHAVYLNEFVQLDSLFTAQEHYELHLPLSAFAWECNLSMFFL